MREEVLSQFYKNCRFEMRFLYTIPPEGQTRGTLAMDPESLLFLYNLRAEDVLILRNLRLVINFYSGQVLKFDRVIERWASVDVTLASEKAKAKVVSLIDDTVLPLLYNDRRGRGGQLNHIRINSCQGQLLTDIREVISGVLGPVVPGQLKMTDLWKLVGKVEGVLRDTAERIKWW